MWVAKGFFTNQRTSTAVRHGLVNVIIFNFNLLPLSMMFYGCAFIAYSLSLCQLPKVVAISCRVLQYFIVKALLHFHVVVIRSNTLLNTRLFYNFAALTWILSASTTPFVKMVNNLSCSNIQLWHQIYPVCHLPVAVLLSLLHRN